MAIRVTYPVPTSSFPDIRLARPLCARSVAAGDQPHASLICEVRVRPLNEHAHAISEADEVHDVNEEPEPPRDPAEDAETPEVRDGAVPAYRREIALVEVPELHRRLVTQQKFDVFRRSLAFLVRRRRHPGYTHSPIIRQCREVADHEDFRVIGHGQIRI